MKVLVERDLLRQFFPELDPKALIDTKDLGAVVEFLNSLPQLFLLAVRLIRAPFKVLLRVNFWSRSTERYVLQFPLNPWNYS